MVDAGFLGGFLNRAQTAAWLGVTPQKFQKIRRTELAALGFPDPAFGTRNGERWDPETLVAWRKSLRPDYLRLIDEAPDDAKDAERDDELDRRAHAIARGEKVH